MNLTSEKSKWLKIAESPNKTEDNSSSQVSNFTSNLFAKFPECRSPAKTVNGEKPLPVSLWLQRLLDKDLPVKETTSEKVNRLLAEQESLDLTNWINDIVSEHNLRNDPAMKDALKQAFTNIVEEMFVPPPKPVVEKPPPKEKPRLMDQIKQRITNKKTLQRLFNDQKQQKIK